MGIPFSTSSFETTVQGHSLHERTEYCRVGSTQQLDVEKQRERWWHLGFMHWSQGCSFSSPTEPPCSLHQPDVGHFHEILFCPYFSHDMRCLQSRHCFQLCPAPMSFLRTGPGTAWEGLSLKDCPILVLSTSAVTAQINNLGRVQVFFLKRKWFLWSI